MESLLKKFLPLKMLSKADLKIRERTIQVELHKILKDQGGHCEDFWSKRLDLDNVQAESSKI